MFRCVLLYLLLLFVLAAQSHCAAARTDTVLLHADLPETNRDGDIYVDVFYKSQQRFIGSLSYCYYFINATGDSIKVLYRKVDSFRFKAGFHDVKLNFIAEDRTSFCDAPFRDLIGRTGTLGPGNYFMLLQIVSDKDTFQANYAQVIDSVLTSSSKIVTCIDRRLSTIKRISIGVFSKQVNKMSSKDKLGDVELREINKIAAKRGLTTRPVANNQLAVDFYFSGLYAGRYIAHNRVQGPSLKKKANQALPNFEPPINILAGSPSIFSQFRNNSKSKTDQDEVAGELTFSTIMSTGQEPNSNIDNNYQEVRGIIELPVGGLPVQLEGLYTTMDNNRKIKSSYFGLAK